MTRGLALRPALKVAAVALLVVALAAPLAACGKRASNLPPEDSRYPRTYPSR